MRIIKVVIAIYSILIAVALSSCAGFSDSFFEMLFDGNNVEVDCIYSNVTLCGDGASFEIYKVEISSECFRKILAKDSIEDLNYHRYRAFVWKAVNGIEEVNLFQKYFEEHECNQQFREIKFNQILKSKNVYYTVLVDQLNRERLFIFDKNTGILYYFSLYEL